jgi:Tfp pilus assembly protein PilF
MRGMRSRLYQAALLVVGLLFSLGDAEAQNAAPKPTGPYLNRGLMAAKQGEYAQAIEEFTEALKLDPKLSRA